ncbi:MAG: AI-2E family transporter [Chloroflexota bacterium]
MTAQQTFRNTLVVILTLAAAYTVYASIRILIVLLIAIIIASAVRPAVLRLTKLRVPLGLAILLVYLALGITLFVLGVVVLPPAINQLAQYITNNNFLANQIINAQDLLQGTLKTVLGHDVTLLDPAAITQSVSTTIHQIVAAFPTMAGEFGGLLGDFVLVVVIGVYWLTARDQTIDFVLHLFPLGQRGLTGEVIFEIENSLGAYIRGIVFVSSFVGIANFIILSLFQVPNAVTLGFIMGITTMLPIIGGYIGAGAATLLALISSPVNALIAFGSFVAVQQVENHYLTPRVMSRSVGLNPILIIVFLFVGSAIGGVIGALIAVPIAGALNILLRHIVIEPRKAESSPQVIDGGVLLTSKDTREAGKIEVPGAATPHTVQ